MPQTNPEQRKAYQAAYRAAHRTQIKAYHQAYMASHPEQRKVYDATYRAAHRTQRKTCSAAYNAGHREERRTYFAAYYVKHREQVKAYSAAYYKIHHERRNIQNATLLANHTERRRQYQKKWDMANKGRRAFYSARQRARKASLPDNLTYAEWEAIKMAYKYKCAYCGRKPRLLTQDHVMPLSKGGGTIKENIVPACQSCNSGKKANLPASPVRLVLL